MSLDITYSRGELYEKYEQTDPELAKKFYNPKDHVGSLLFVGGYLTILGTISAVAVLILFVSVMGVKWMSTPPSAFVIIGAICGPITASGLITLAVWYCKKRNILSEPLKVAEINSIAGKMLVDPLKGMMSL